MNLVSCKLHYYENREKEKIIEDLNKELELKDIRILNIIEVSGSFDSKECSNNREYHYILPSFCLEPKILNEGKDSENKEFKPNYKFKIKPEFKEKI